MSEAQSRRIKVGIDVGGTFTHAVAVNIATMDLVGKAVVPTTHHHKEGVAAGVVASMQKLLEETGIAVDEVILIAHSTTQATNALIEGDVAKVGIIGMATGPAAIRAKREANPGNIELSKGKYLHTAFRFIDTERDYTEDAIRRAIEELRAEGCEAIVSSESFGVDNPAREIRVAEIAIQMGLPASSSSALSQLYGLRVRTRTAVINASMLPKMLETANLTEKAVRESGITVPLMVMRSDGGIMNIEEMRKRPILTMLSGPAAGVAAALMYERISDGSMIEVGGTTSDICVIKNGRPIVTNGEIGGHRLFVRTLDVRTVGIAGGSVARFANGKLIDVGPRSAHIAKLKYEAFTPGITSAEVTTICPLPAKGDPSDYLALKINGSTEATHTLTPTGASNILGLATEYAKGDSDSIRTCFNVVGKLCGQTAEQLADRLLDVATKKVAEVVKRMLEEHKLTDKQITLVGGGGGAEAITPYTAKRMKMPYRIARNTEVISAIGVALGIIQDTVERTMMNPSESDIVTIRREAFESVLRMGADAATIQVIVEIDRQTKRVSATASGTPELRTRMLGGQLPSSLVVKQTAAKALAMPSESMKAVCDEESWLQVYTCEKHKPILFGLMTTILTPVVVIDREGIVRLQVSDARVDYVSSSEVDGLLGMLLETYTTYGDGGMVIPDVFLVKPGQIADLTGLAEASQVASVARVEMQSLLPTDKVAIISSRKG
jgi:N-methylhydantoinase A/oxoprolinase/acetone carboxylase beta subunit